MKKRIGRRGKHKTDKQKRGGGGFREECVHSVMGSIFYTITRVLHFHRGNQTL